VVDIEAAVPPSVCLFGRILNLERYCRNFAALSKDPDLLKFFVADEKRAAKFRQQLAEEDRLPPEFGCRRNCASTSPTSSGFVRNVSSAWRCLQLANFRHQGQPK
jgi:hypothetical protein